MTVKELRRFLEFLPDEMPVFMAERKTEFAYGLVNSADTKIISLVDEMGDEIKASEKVVVLDEE